MDNNTRLIINLSNNNSINITNFFFKQNLLELIVINKNYMKIRKANYGFLSGLVFNYELIFY